MRDASQAERMDKAPFNDRGTSFAEEGRSSAVSSADGSGGLRIVAIRSEGFRPMSRDRALISQYVNLQTKIKALTKIFPISVSLW